MATEKRLLDREDEIQDSYEVNSDGMYGHLILSKSKFMFIEEKGLAHKKYYLMLEIPYKQITNITVDEHGQLIVVESDGKKYNFTSFDPLFVPINMIENRFKELTETATQVHTSTYTYIA